jgi:hypothetical protein
MLRVRPGTVSVAQQEIASLLQGISCLADLASLFTVVATVLEASEGEEAERIKLREAMLNYLCRTGGVDVRLGRRLLVDADADGALAGSLVRALAKESMAEISTSWLPAVAATVGPGIGLGATLLAWLFGGLIREALDDLEVNAMRRASPRVSEEEAREYLFLREVNREFAKVERRAMLDWQRALEDRSLPRDDPRVLVLSKVLSGVQRARARARRRYLVLGERLW